MFGDDSLVHESDVTVKEGLLLVLPWVIRQGAVEGFCDERQIPEKVNVSLPLAFVHLWWKRPVLLPILGDDVLD